jgi:uncharacterized protein (DUF58 family)
MSLIGGVDTQWRDPARRAPDDGAAAAELAARLPRLVARAHEIAASVASGAHGRRRAGAGETFWQYRPFASGESASRVDWRRSARGDHLFVREREWEAAHDYHLWMDCSSSMSFASTLAPEDKLSRGVTLGLALADVLVRGGERVAALGLTPPASARNIVDRLARALYANAAVAAKQELPPDVGLKPRARLVLISDFLTPPAELAAQLKRYAAAGVSGALLMVIDPSEESFPFSGETLFLDTDGGVAFHAGDAQSLKNDYAQLYATHKNAVAAAARAAGFAFLQHHTDRPAAEAALALTMCVQGVEERR